MITDSLRAIFTTNLGVRKGERVLVFTDRINPAEVLTPTDRCRRERLRDIALLTAEIGRAFAKDISYLEYTATMSHGAEPPEEVWLSAFGKTAVRQLDRAGLLQPLLTKRLPAEGMKEAEGIIGNHLRSAVAVVIALSNFSTSHTGFRNLLTGICGSRYASMPLFDVAMLEGAMQVNWESLARLTDSVADVLNRAESVEIKTPNGTHLKLSKRGRKALPDTGILTAKGSFGNLPAGEVYIAPLEGTAEGRLVLEWAPTRHLDSPVTLTLRRGIVTDIAGNEPYAEVIRMKCGERDENRNIAELGIGTNEQAKRPDNILESEKILGTVHVALGDNSSFGGTVRTPFHQDFVFFKPTVTLTGKQGAKTVLMRDGQLLVKTGARKR